MINYVIGGAIILLMILAVRKTIKDRKNGGCGCGCSSCSGHCHEETKK